MVLLARDDSVHPACHLLERMPTELKLLRRELEIERRKNSDQDSNYQVELGQCRYFLKIEEDKVKSEIKERELLLEDFKSLGLKNKRLEDEMKGRKGNPGKKIKLTENIQRDLEEARKQAEEQRKLTKYWKEQTKELRGKTVGERQAWEDKYKTDMGKHSQENAELKIKLKAERISRAELQAENRSILDALRAMEQSLVEHENFIIELQGENAYQNVMLRGLSPKRRGIERLGRHSA